MHVKLKILLKLTTWRRVLVIYLLLFLPGENSLQSLLGVARGGGVGVGMDQRLAPAKEQNAVSGLRRTHYGDSIGTCITIYTCSQSPLR